MAQKISGQIIFGNIIIPTSQIFLLRKNVFGIINHKPKVNGHVLLCCRRQVPKLQQLTQIETLDLFCTAQEVCRKLATVRGLQYEIVLQNGKDAGQTIPHLHLHLLPKVTIGLEEQNQQVRTEEDMAQQAEEYRTCFEQSVQ